MWVFDQIDWLNKTVNAKARTPLLWTLIWIIASKAGHGRWEKLKTAQTWQIMSQRCPGNHGWKGSIFIVCISLQLPCPRDCIHIVKHHWWSPTQLLWSNDLKHRSGFLLVWRLRAQRNLVERPATNDLLDQPEVSFQDVFWRHKEKKTMPWLCTLRMVSTEAKINKNATSIIPALTPTPDTGHAMDKGFSRKQDHLLYTTLLQETKLYNYTWKC